LAPFVGGQPGIFAFWHECLPLMPALSLIAQELPGYRRTPVHTLVSRHRDGRFIGEVVRRFGIEPVLGSTSKDGADKGGASGVRNLLALLKKGDLIGITPDGPRGPRRQAIAGVAQLAALAGVPVLPCAARATPRIVLGTWDRMPVPLPFGRGVIVCAPAIVVPREGWQDSLPAIEAAMTQAIERSDRLCLD
jgi:lysophospholipid acyltransferase (LPLAT)-like uncharacterized protein